MPLRLPDGGVTENKEEYADAWFALGKEVESYFPGYYAMGFDPHVVIEKHRMHHIQKDTYITEDRIKLSILAIKALREAFSKEQNLKER